MTCPRWWVSAASVLMAVGIAGCGSQVTPGRPEAGPSATSASGAATPAKSEPLNQADVMPCTALEPADVTAMGLDPATKKVDNISGEVQTHGCRWSNSDLIVSFLGTDATVALYSSQDRFVNRRQLGIAGLPSLSFQLADTAESSGVDNGGCSVIADLPGGGALFVAVSSRIHSKNPSADICTAAVRFMEQAAPILLKR